GTTGPVEYRIKKASPQLLQLYLIDTRLPDYRKFPLITTRFESAVDRIIPVQTPAMKNVSMFTIELRESVPYFIEQKEDQLLVHFEASTISPRPLEAAKLPPWKKVMAQTAVKPTSREAQEQVKEIVKMPGQVSAASALTGGVVTEVNDAAAEYDIDSRKRIDPYTDEETELDIFRQSKTKKLYTGEKIALDFYETDVKSVFRILKEVSGKNFAIDKDVAGKVTLTFDDPVTWEHVLDLVLKMNKLGKIYEGEIIRIATLETLKAEEEQLKEKLKAKQDAVRQEDHITMFFPVNYAKASDINKNHIRPILTTGDKNQEGKSTVDERLNTIVITDVPLVIKQASEIIQKLDKEVRQEVRQEDDRITVFIPINYGSATVMNENHIKPILTKPILTTDEEGRGKSQDGVSSVDERLNTIVITDVPLVIKQAKEIIRRLDLVTPQVIIEARIVEATTNFSREIGVQWGAASGKQPTSAMGITETGGAWGGDWVSDKDLPYKGTLDNTMGVGHTYGGNMAMNVPIASSAMSIGFNFSKLAGTPFLLNAKLLAMESQGEGKIISAPKIVTLDNKTAIIQRGAKVPYPQRTTEGTISVAFAEATLKLEVTPHITSDKRINLVIDVQKDEPDWTRTVQDVPAITTKNAHTELLINDGDTVVIGGIIETTKSFTDTGVPWLSKIPLLGWLFKSTAKTDDKTELLIFITPRIVQLENLEN
ncbi:MAG: type IV pilus secretin PilQ, partial [Pseudomonadota bacterium]